MLLLALYRASYAGPMARTASRPAFTGEPLAVGLGRAPGGPSEWITIAEAFAQVQEDLERPVVLHYALDYDDQMSLLESGKADVALMSVHGYLHASRARSVVIVAAPMVEGHTSDTAVLVVSGSSRIRSIDELRGRRLAVPPGLIGEPFVEWLLEHNGLEGDFFGERVETSAQDIALTLVAKGDVDAAVVRCSSLCTWEDGTFRILTESPKFGPAPLVASTRIDSVTLESLRESLLAFRPASDASGDRAITGFRLTADDEYEFARELERIDGSSKGESAEEAK